MTRNNSSAARRKQGKNAMILRFSILLARRHFDSAFSPRPTHASPPTLSPPKTANGAANRPCEGKPRFWVNWRLSDAGRIEGALLAAKRKGGGGESDGNTRGKEREKGMRGRAAAGYGIRHTENDKTKIILRQHLRPLFRLSLDLRLMMTAVALYSMLKVNPERRKRHHQPKKRLLFLLLFHRSRQSCSLLPLFSLSLCFSQPVAAEGRADERARLKNHKMVSPILKHFTHTTSWKNKWQIST